MSKNILIIAAVVGISVLAFGFTRKPAIAPSPIPSPSPASLPKGLIIEAQKGTIQNLQAGPVSFPQQVTVDVTARQWAFEPSTIRVPLGSDVTLRIRSIDVKHGFALPQHNIDVDLESGKTTIVNFTADKAGTFSFRCSVFCGSGHATMTGTLIVE